MSTSPLATVSLVPSGAALEPYLDQLAHLVAEHGLAPFEGDVARLVVRLHAAGHTGPAVDVLADRNAPTVARERALGVALALLATAPARRPVPAGCGAAA
ncbi:MAG: hypothetical protein U0Q03_18680 [Acidimicrobiales bacterium]